MESLLIKNVNAVLPDCVLNGASVRADGGIITEISENAEPPEGCRVIDGGGGFLTPGFIDLHIHGRCFADAMDADGGSLAVIARDLLSFGVTGFLITTQSAPLERTLGVIRAAVDYIENPAADGARPLGIYLEGPYLAEEKKGAQLIESGGGVDLKGLSAMLEAGGGHIRVVALAPELEGAAEAIQMIKASGAVVSAAHSCGSYEEALTAIDAGLSLATHTFNAMLPLGHREPALVGACLTDSRVTCEVISDGVHLHPAVVKLVYAAKGADNMALISDSIAAAGIPDGEYDYEGRVFTVKEGVIRLGDGTLAGSTLSLDAAVRKAAAFTGCALHEAVRMASLTPARVIGLDKERGSIEVGKAADLVLLSVGMEVQSIILGGRPV